MTGGKNWELTGYGTGRKFSDISFCVGVMCWTGRVLFGVVGVSGVLTGLDFFGVVCVGVESCPLGAVTNKSRNLLKKNKYTYISIHLTCSSTNLFV